jgi:hypothetical protein
MKQYKVNLLDKDRGVVLSHNLWALNDKDANTQAEACVSNARDKSVVDFELVEKLFPL